jgi:hypothetical protein
MIFTRKLLLESLSVRTDFLLQVLHPPAAVVIALSLRRHRKTGIFVEVAGDFRQLARPVPLPTLAKRSQLDIE